MDVVLFCFVFVPTKEDHHIFINYSYLKYTRTKGLLFAIRQNYGLLWIMESGGNQTQNLPRINLQLTI